MTPASDPINRFEFATATRIIFGAGVFREIPALVSEMGSRAFVVTGKTGRGLGKLGQLLNSAGVDCVSFHIDGEPTTDAVRKGLQAARAGRCDCVIGFGGGSALDAAKAIASLLTNEGELFDYLEVIGRGQALTKAAAPWLAIPTTAGTGTEVTRNAVLASPADRVKASLRSPLMLARVALIDPELTCELPSAITASTGLDALTQVIEPYLSIKANPMTDALCVDGIRRAARSLHHACECGSDTAAREDLCVASLFGGLALANAGLGAVHGFAAPIGGMFPAPHGAVCAALLPHALEINLQALRNRPPASPAVRRFDEIAKLLTGNQSAQANDGIIWVAELCRALKIPSLRTYGITGEDFPLLIQNAAKASSMKNNPVLLTESELAEILTRAW
jgi:alcohol dehydrogenase class IV